MSSIAPTLGALAATATCIAILAHRAFSDTADHEQAVAACNASKRAALAPHGPTDPADVARSNAARLLKRLGRCWTESRRERLYGQAHDMGALLGPALLEIIEDPAHPDIVEAVRLATELHLTDAVPALRDLASSGRGDVGALAIEAVEAIEPWRVEELWQLLERKEPELVATTLAVLTRRPADQRPVARFVQLLGSTDAQVRAAAVAAVPEGTADEPAITALCRFARNANGSAAEAAALALGRTALPLLAEVEVMRLLGSDDWRVRAAAARALGSCPRPLAAPSVVLAALRRPRATVLERVNGWSALERTRSLPPAAIVEVMPHLHPLVRMLAARCLVTAGDRRGLGVLVDLLDERESDRADDEEAQATREGAHDVLVELARTDYGTVPADWQQWLKHTPHPAPRRLNCAPPMSW